MNGQRDDALRLVDKLLAERPDKVGHDFSEATRAIVTYRNELVAAWRRSGSEADRHRLGRVNAVLSAVLGGQYPLGHVPWESIEAARAQLADLG